MKESSVAIILQVIKKVQNIVHTLDIIISQDNQGHARW